MRFAQVIAALGGDLVTVIGPTADKAVVAETYRAIIKAGGKIEGKGKKGDLSPDRLLLVTELGIEKRWSK